MNPAVLLGKSKFPSDICLGNGDTCSVTVDSSDGRKFRFFYAPTSAGIARTLEVYRFCDSAGREVIIGDLVDVDGVCVGKLLEESALDRLIGAPPQVRKRKLPAATRKLYCQI